VLNLFYKRHSFRYGDPVDFKAESKTIFANCLHGEIVGYLDELNKKFSTLEVES